jgi:hypothetical protein
MSAMETTSDYADATKRFIEAVHDLIKIDPKKGREIVEFLHQLKDDDPDLEIKLTKFMFDL